MACPCAHFGPLRCCNINRIRRFFSSFQNTTFDNTSVACWIHARRYWHEARDNDAARANMALGFIARLSQIEHQLAAGYPRKNLQGERDFAAVALGRQQHSLPILNDFKAWMDSELASGRILPKSEIRKAFTYTINQWDALCRYTQEGFLSYDNNVAERLVKTG